MIDNDKYQDLYRIQSSRLQSWDYRCNGAYFITICTKNGIQYFGDITGSEMKLSHIGILADVYWYEIKNHFINVELGGFIVMPNHIHGIILLNNTDNSSTETLNLKSLNKQQQNTMTTISPKKGSISTIVRSYKSAVSRNANRLGYNFSWQSRFHDHIIRNQKSYNHIKEYIKTNPQRWKEDRFYISDNNKSL